MRTHLISSCFRGVALVLLAAGASAGGVRIVDQPALGSFATIQAAVDAASEGAVLLVADGTYPGFTIDGKSLSVFALTNAAAKVAGTVEVKNLLAAQTVLLVGLSATGATVAVESAPALKLSSNNGRVRVQDCTLKGGVGSQTDPHHHGAGGDAVRIDGSSKVALSGCTLRGGAGGSTPVGNGDYESNGGPGGDGIEAVGSTVVLYACDLLGGKGGSGAESAGDGGMGYRVPDFGVVAVGSAFTGGNGGYVWYYWGPGAAGGHGLFLDSGAQGQIVDCTFAGGAGGLYAVGEDDFFGPAGQGRFGTGVFNDHPGEASSLNGASLLADDARWNITGSGVAGDRVFFLRSFLPAFQVPSPVNGIWLVPIQLKLAWPNPVVVVDPAGTISFEVAAPRVPSGNVRQVVYAQGLFRSSAGVKLLGAPLNLLSLKRNALPDCDGDGVSDFVGIIEGTTPDCDHDLMPDACEIASGAEPDCDANGVPDGCDLISGSSTDCNANGIVDECEALPDCNGNGDADICDFANGTSVDGNANGIPDECDPHVTRYVDDDAAPGGDGSLASPFQTLKQAFDASITLDEIAVLDGLYTGSANRNLDFDTRSLTVRSVNGAANCVIDCQGLARAFDLGDAATARIEGLTFTRGGSPSFTGDGGAIHSDQTLLTLRDCVFTDCSAIEDGGAIAMGSPFGSVRSRIERCQFFGNSAPNNGGAIVTGGLGPVLIDCLFAENSAARGGALYVSDYCSTWVQHSVFRDNFASVGGGAAYKSHTTHGGSDHEMRIDDCLFVGNSSPRGAAVRVTGGNFLPAARAVLTNCTLTGNVASTSGAGMEASLRGELVVANCVLWNNDAPNGAEITLAHDKCVLVLSSSDVEGGLAGISHAPLSSITWGPGELDLDPLFVDVDGTDDDPLTFDDNDYRLLDGSPCVDAGDVSQVVADLFDIDLDGNTSEPMPFDLDFLARFFDDPDALDTGVGPAPIVDMGCYERRP